MKIILLGSSLRKNGNTAAIMELMEEQLLNYARSDNVQLEIERINLGGHDIKPCLGCRACFDRGEDRCPLKDDLLAIRDSMLACDGIIMASPIYVEDVNGTMKTFLDRLAFNSHRPAFAGRTAFFVTTSAIGSSGHAIRTMRLPLTGWGFNTAGSVKFRAGALSKKETLHQMYDDKIQKASYALYKAVRERKAERPSLMSLIIFKVARKSWMKPGSEADAYDYGYWRDKGWLDKKCSFYIPHKAGWIKIQLAKFFGGLIALFYT